MAMGKEKLVLSKHRRNVRYLIITPCSKTDGLWKLVRAKSGEYMKTPDPSKGRIASGTETLLIRQLYLAFPVTNATSGREASANCS